jgi:acetoacetyl-CoA reductase
MKNRIAVVTGGIGDLGTAICRHLAQLGAKVVAVDHLEKKDVASWQEEQKKSGYDFAYFVADITQYQRCEKMIADIEHKIGNIDILVNNAGINRDALFRKMTPEQWGSVMHTDLDGLFNMTRPIINGMCDRGYGRIVNISSVSAQLGQFGQTNYSAAKSAVHGFTKSLAREVAKQGVTVNTISPGFIESKMVLKIPEKVRDQIISQIPVGHLGKPEDIARTVAFLVDENSGFITGSNLSINGGIYMC